MRNLAILAGCLLALLPAAQVAWRFRDLPQLGVEHDDTVYWITAKSLAEGNGYRIASLPSNAPQTKYPPLFPLLLAGVWQLSPSFPANLTLAAGVLFTFVPFLLVLACLYFRHYGLPGRQAVMVGALLALNPYVAYFGVSMMTEVLLTVLLLASLLLAERDRPLAAGILGGFAFLTKAAAGPLLITVPLVYAARRKYRSAAVFAAGMLPFVLGWGAWSMRQRPASRDLVTLFNTDYLGYQTMNVNWGNLDSVVSSNLNDLFSSIAETVCFHISGTYLGDQAARLIALAAIFGIVRLARASRRCQYPAFAAAYAGMLLVWHFPPNPRLILPLAPLVLAGIWTEAVHVAGIARAAFARPKLPDRIAAALACSLLLVFGGGVLVAALRGLYRDLPAAAEEARTRAKRQSEALSWIAANTPAGARFFTDLDTTLYLYTGRRAERMPVPPRLYYAADRAGVLDLCGRVRSFMNSRKLEYALLTEWDFGQDPLPAGQREAIRAAIGKDSNFVRQWTGNGAEVYRLRRPE